MATLESEASELREEVAREVGLNFEPDFSGSNTPVLDLRVEDLCCEGSGIFVEVRALYIPRSLRGQGYGSRAMRALEQAVARRGGGIIHLEAFPYTGGKGATLDEIKKLISWYEKLGFELCAPLDLDEIYRALEEKWGPDWDGLLGYSDVEGAVDMEKEVRKEGS